MDQSPFTISGRHMLEKSFNGRCRQRCCTEGNYWLILDTLINIRTLMTNLAIPRESSVESRLPANQ